MKKYNLRNGLVIIYHNEIDALSLCDARSGESLLVVSINSDNSCGFLFSSPAAFITKNIFHPGTAIGRWYLDRVKEASKEEKLYNFSITIDFSAYISNPDLFTNSKFYNQKIKTYSAISIDDELLVKYNGAYHILALAADSPWFKQYRVARNQYYKDKNKKELAMKPEFIFPVFEQIKKHTSGLGVIPDGVNLEVKTTDNTKPQNEESPDQPEPVKESVIAMEQKHFNKPEIMLLDGPVKRIQAGPQHKGRLLAVWDTDNDVCLLMLDSATGVLYRNMEEFNAQTSIGRAYIEFVNENTSQVTFVFNNSRLKQHTTSIINPILISTIHGLRELILIDALGDLIKTKCFGQYLHSLPNETTDRAKPTEEKVVKKDYEVISGPDNIKVKISESLDPITVLAKLKTNTDRGEIDTVIEGNRVGGQPYWLEVTCSGEVIIANRTITKLRIGQVLFTEEKTEDDTKDIFQGVFSIKRYLTARVNLSHLKLQEKDIIIELPASAENIKQACAFVFMVIRSALGIDEQLKSLSALATKVETVNKAIEGTVLYTVLDDAWTTTPPNLRLLDPRLKSRKFKIVSWDIAELTD